MKQLKQLHGLVPGPKGPIIHLAALLHVEWPGFYFVRFVSWAASVDVRVIWAPGVGGGLSIPAPGGRLRPLFIHTRRSNKEKQKSTQEQAKRKLPEIETLKKEELCSGWNDHHPSRRIRLRNKERHFGPNSQLRVLCALSQSDRLWFICIRFCGARMDPASGSCRLRSSIWFDSQFVSSLTSAGGR